MIRRTLFARAGLVGVAFAIGVFAARLCVAEEAAQGVPAADREVDAAAPAPATSEQIAEWIRQLDDNQYVVREQATAELLASGASALEPLLATANGDRPEPADRAVWILRKLSVGQDVALQRAALEKLVQLKERPQIVAAATNALAELRHLEAVAAIKRLGGQFLVSYPGPEAQLIAPQVLLDENWRGDRESMKLFSDLQGLRHVIVIGANVTADGLAELGRAPSLELLWVYRTKLKTEDLPALGKALPRVTIDFRRGALLGVAGDPREGGPGPATVTEVRAGSVAAKAGMRVGDIVRTFNGKDVHDFKDLTSKIADHFPGDKVTLQVLRGGEQIEFEVELGQWSAEQILSQISPR